MKIINKVTGETVATITTNHSMTLDEAINLVGEIHPENEDENVKIGDEWFYYDDLTMEWRGGARPNAGRKPTGRKMRSMRLTDHEYEQVKNYITAGRKDGMAVIVKMDVVDRYGDNDAYKGGTVEINVRSGQSYTYTLSNILGVKRECLYITSEYKNLEQSQAYWTRENGKIRGWLPSVLTIDDINRAAELI